MIYSIKTYTGWLTATSWQTSIAGSSYLAGTIIQSLLILNIESYVPKAWHGTLLAIAIVSIAIFFNTVLVRRLPTIEVILVIFHLLGVAIAIPLWALAPRSSSSVLTEYYNPNGWSSNGVATMISILYPLISMLGFDCSVHMGQYTSAPFVAG
jgi:hypothetical protein